MAVTRLKKVGEGQLKLPIPERRWFINLPRLFGRRKVLRELNQNEAAYRKKADRKRDV